MKLEINWEMNFHKFWQADKYYNVILIDAYAMTKIPSNRQMLEAAGTSFAGHTEDTAGNIPEIVVSAINGSTLYRLVGLCYSGILAGFHNPQISDQPSFIEFDVKKFKGLRTLEGLTVSSAQIIFRNKYVKPYCKTTKANHLEYIAPLPANIKCLPADVTRKQLIVVAGAPDAKKKIMEYCFNQQMWKTLAKLPTRIELFSVTYSMACNSFYFVGGCSRGTEVNKVIRWSLKTRKFLKSTRTIEPRLDAAIISLNNGDLMIVGGNKALNVSTTVERWSRKTGYVQSLMSINEGKGGSRLVKVGNFIYCIGGRNLFTQFKTVERYNLSQKRWSTVAPLHHERFHCGVMNVKGKIYVIGGGSDVIECYCPKKNEWIEVCTLRGSQNVETCVRHNNQLFALGSITLFTSDGDWGKLKFSDTIMPINGNIYGAFSVPLH